MSDYPPPPWSHKPTDDWSLLEIKGGVQVGEHSLTKACTVLGRAQDMVDVTLAHESCSRQHARLAFDASGVLWLRDLASTHGTTVNKKRMPAQACGKGESDSRKPGARGVVVYPGDVLQFGASSRLFCIQGPVAVTRGSVKAAALQQKLQQSSQHRPQAPLVIDEHEQPQNENDEEDVGAASWGIDMDDHVEEPQNEKFELKEEEIPEKHRKAFEQIKALRYKLSNIQLESERIRCKGELTTGQEKQLHRNEEREKEITRKIDEKERELHHILHPDSDNKRQASSTEYKGLEADEDVDDQTKGNSSLDGLFTSDGETEQSLTAKWKSTYKQRSSLRKELEVVEQKATGLAHQVKQLEATGDEEAFFLQNDCTLANEAYTKLQSEEARLETFLRETSRLLTIANPHLTIDIEQGYIGEGKPPTPSDDMMAPPLPLSFGKKPAEFSMPPPPPIAPSIIPAKRTTPTASDLSVPEPKRKRSVVGPEMPPPPGGEGNPSARSTLSGLFSSSSEKAGKHVSRSQQTFVGKRERGFGDLTPAPADKNNTSLVGKVDKWQAPKDQDGSGRSKLNDKFAGKY